MNNRPIDLCFDGHASKDLSHCFDRKINKQLPFNLLNCYLVSRDEDLNGITYTLSIGEIAEIGMEPAKCKEVLNRYQILKNENQ